MKNKNYGLYAIAVAIVVVGALALGIRPGSLGIFGVVLICPLMMLFMMRGMGGTGGGQDKEGSHTDHDDRASHDEPSHRA